MSNCRKLKSLAGIGSAVALREVDAFGCTNLEKLPDDFSDLKHLEVLNVRNCRKLKSLVGIGSD